MAPPNPKPPDPAAARGRLVIYSVGVVVLFIAVGALLFYGLEQVTSLPISLSVLLQVILAAVLGVAAIYAINAVIRTVVGRAWGVRRAGQASAIFRILAYVVLALVLLSIVGVSSLALLAGGTFAGLVIGLAGQDVISSLFAGIVILAANPYRVGERVTITTWQYGLVVPAYPPKFYSQDYLTPGYTGMIRDIGMFYTTLQTDEATTMRVPNNIMVQAAIISHEVARRPVRTKYEIAGVARDPQEVVTALRAAVVQNEWIADPDSVSVTINQATANSYVVAIDAWCRGAYEEPPRSAILLTAMRTVRELKASETRSSAG